MFIMTYMYAIMYVIIIYCDMISICIDIADLNSAKKVRKHCIGEGLE